MIANVEIVGLDKLVADFGEAAAMAQALVQAALVKASTLMQQSVRHEAPHRTGALQRSVMNEVSENIAITRVNEKYGVYVEDGTRAHEIRPVSKRALYWKGAPHPVRLVRHPGTKANPFFARGVGLATIPVLEVFEEVRTILLTKLAGK